MANSNNDMTTTNVPTVAQYYKLTNSEECHNGVQFKDGLLIDPVQFDTNQECGPGGIYFCTEDNIHRWLYYNHDIGLMKWMRKVTIPSDANFQDLKHINKSKADRIILGSREPIPNHYYMKAIQFGTLHPRDYLRFVETRTHELYMAVVQQKGCALQYVHEQTDEICMAAVKQDGRALVFVKKDQNNDICMAAVQQNGRALKFVKNQTPEICMAAVKSNVYAFTYVKNQTDELCMAAVQQNGFALRYVKNQTDEICMAAVKRKVFALRYVKNQTDEICMAAVQQNGFALRYVKNQTDEICMAAVQQNGHVILLIQCPEKRMRITSGTVQQRVGAALHHMQNNKNLIKQLKHEQTAESMLLRNGKRVGNFADCNKNKKTKVC